MQIFHIDGAGCNAYDAGKGYAEVAANGGVPMFELISLNDRDYYLESPAKIGLHRLDDTHVCLIDSGNDKDAGRKVRQTLDKKGWKLDSIYVTHSNADHIGGCRYLQNQTGCAIYAPGMEQCITCHPILEPAFLYGGFPSRDLRHKFLMAQESTALPLTPEAMPEGMEAIPLPGHFFDMTGYRTAEGTVYLADCLSSREILEKYRVAFIYDVAAYLNTLEKVKQMQADHFVPAHAPATDRIADLAQYNMDVVYEVADRILRYCSDPIGFEDLLQKLFRDYGLVMNFEQYVLIGSTLRSYLSWLRDTDRIEPLFEDSCMLWKKLP